MLQNKKSTGSLNLIKDIFKYLSQKRKIQLFLTIVSGFASGFAEMINLSAVVPFLIIITEPTKISDIPFISVLQNFLDIENQNELIVPITLIFAITALFSGLLRIFNLWLNFHMSALIGNDLSMEAYRKTLLKPYLFHIQSNSSAILNTMANNIPSTVRVIERSLIILSSITIVISILIGLLIFNFKITSFVITLLIIVYFCFSFFSRKKLKSNSIFINKKQKKQIKVIQESLGSIKDIIIFNCKKIYLKNYKKLDKSIRVLSSENRFLSTFPRYGIESLTLFMLIVSSLLLKTQDGYRDETLVLLGVFALAAQKLLPNLQIIYNGVSAIRSNSQQARNVLDILSYKIPKDNFVNNLETLNFTRSIKFDNVFFKYSKQSKNVIQGLNFELFKGENIGIIGKTGSGKSTFIDILLGLLKPDKGKLLVDGRSIYDSKNNETLSKWQNLITYVPQDIFLTDNSFLENIAYGIPSEFINIELVIQCAKNARIHDFIESTIDGYKTFVGERGIKLSGGQIQRIGIARALYKNSKIIVFDEATSALDNQTEAEVIESIKSIKNDFTIIMIAHRLNSLKNCQRIIDIDSGRIVRIISGNDLLEKE